MIIQLPPEITYDTNLQTTRPRRMDRMREVENCEPRHGGAWKGSKRSSSSLLRSPMIHIWNDFVQREWMDGMREVENCEPKHGGAWKGSKRSSSSS